MKKLIIAASLLLSGCAVQYGEVVTADEVGKARIAAEQKQYDGEVKFRAGSGITYTRANSQCGNNCGKYAAREVEFQREQEARYDEVMAKHKAEMKRQDDLYKRQKLASDCQQHINIQMAAYEDEYRDMLRTKGYKASQDFAGQLVKARKNYMSYVNKCIEYHKDK
jgi:hypothetical protein